MDTEHESSSTTAASDVKNNAAVCNNEEQNKQILEEQNKQMLEEQNKQMLEGQDKSKAPFFDKHAANNTERQYAQMLDARDSLRHLRAEFHIPQKAGLRRSVQSRSSETGNCIYLCGSAIGLQPRQTSTFVQQYLDQWATQGLFAGMAPIPDSPLPSWLDAEPRAAQLMARLVGARPNETVLMAGLTTNLHLLMASFYTPQKGGRNKIITEEAAFSSDVFAVESQVSWHGLEVAETVVRIPSNPLIDETDILAAIDEHNQTTAVLLLSGVQYRTGQLLDIPRITAYAQSKGIIVGWDLAHAAGNVELKLHDWNVDFAVWCTYKYLNSGPGALGGAFVHERHGTVDTALGVKGYRPRLAGWWGGAVGERFKMENTFRPAKGAAGFLVSNTSILDLTSITASLLVFNKTSMAALRAKSLSLTGYLEHLLFRLQKEGGSKEGRFEIITSPDPKQRGAQLSLKLEPDVLSMVVRELETAGIIVDVRRPSILRISPAPLYNSYSEVWEFVDALERALRLV